MKTKELARAVFLGILASDGYGTIVTNTDLVAEWISGKFGVQKEEVLEWIPE